MNDAVTQLMLLLLNPWNGVVAVGVILGVEVLKYTAPTFFAGRGNRLLRIICVAGCVVGYQVPGPWIDAEALFQVKLVIGGIVGGMATMAWAIVADALKFFRRHDPEPKIGWLEAAKKWATIIGAILAAISGFYGAWFKPETGAKNAYQVTSKAIDDLRAQVTEQDKACAINAAVSTQRLDAIEKELTRRLAYRPKAAAKASASQSMEMMVDDMAVQMPAAEDVFK